MKEGWTLDRNMVTLIAAIAMQTGGAFWWASKVESTMAASNERIVKLESRVEESRSIFERMVRVEVKLDMLINNQGRPTQSER